jgi:hypothetical protein
MTTRKMNWGIFGMLAVTFLILGSAVEAGAETLTCRCVTNIIKMEVLPFPDIEGHKLFLNMRDGLALFENGDFATCQVYIVNDLGGRQPMIQGYLIISFIDGSSIVSLFHQTVASDPSGKFAITTKSTGEIIKGTGRFEGLKGSLPGEGMVFKPDNWAKNGKSIGNWILPSK